MLSLKTSLPFKIICCLILVTFFYTFYNIKNDIYKTVYNDQVKSVLGNINTINIDGNKLSLEIIGREKILVNYYFKEEKELFSFKEKYKHGDYIKITGELVKPSKNTNFNLFNYQNYLKSKKIYWIAKATNINLIKKNTSFLYKSKNFIKERIDKFENTGNYLNTFILGDSKEIDGDVTSSYQQNGVSHLFAISGMHITLLSSILIFLLNKISKYEKINYYLIIIFLLLYTFMTNFSPSVIRATLLFILLYFNKISLLKIKSVYILIFIACLLLLYNPFYLYNIAFLFSFTISFFLMLFGNIVNQYQNYFMKTFIVSIISFISSIPIMINNYFAINLLSPFINIIFVPLISIVIFPLSLLTFIFPLLEPIFNMMIVILEMLSLFIAKVKLEIILFKIPLFIFILYYIFITFVLHKMKQKKPYFLFYLLLVIIIHSSLPYFNKSSIITFLDVGQGDSTLISMKNKHILIDTGGILKYKQEAWQEKNRAYSIAKSTTIPYMKSVGISELEYLFLTHGDVDHADEAINLIENFKVKKVVLNSGTNNGLENKIIDFLKKRKIPYYFISEQTIKIKNIAFNFINNKNMDNENEDSLVLFTKIANRNILLMGDAGNFSELNIIDEYNLPKMDILKVGHHGSKYSSSVSFLKIVEPRVSIISVGLNNRYNHPHPETIDKLMEFRLPYLETSINGSIKIELNRFKIYTCL